MRQVVTQVQGLAQGSLRARTGCPIAACAGECLIPGGDPQPVEDPAVAGIVVESGRVALGPQGGDPPGQCLEFQQGVMVRAKAGAHKGDAVTRSGLTWSLRSAPWENNTISAPSRSVAARWKRQLHRRGQAGYAEPDLPNDESDTVVPQDTPKDQTLTISHAVLVTSNPDPGRLGVPGAFLIQCRHQRHRVLRAPAAVVTGRREPPGARSGGRGADDG